MDYEKEEKIKLKAQKDYPEFTSSVDGLSVEDLQKNMTRYAKYREEVELEKSKDKDLNDAKDSVRALSGPYGDSMKALKVKMAYLNVLIEEKGGDASAEDSAEDSAESN